MQPGIGRVAELTVPASRIIAEIRSLDKAVDRAIAELRQLRESAGKRMGGPVAKIFDAQLLIADDREFLNQVKEQIQSQKRNAGYVYNKLVQEKETAGGAEKPPTFNGIPHTRVEERVTAQLPIKKLPGTKNPLQWIGVFDCAAVEPPEGQHNWNHFIDSCRHRGIDNALDLIAPPIRKLYANALKESANSIWNPEKLWSFMPSVIEKSGLMSD